jgi:hypothetical protein
VLKERCVTARPSLFTPRISRVGILDIILERSHMAKKKQPDTTPENVLTVDLNQQAKEILKRAQDKGVEHALMFTTTFKRYMELVAHLIILEKAIKEHGPIVVKEYVKERQNIVVNPAISAYNQTATAADKTAQILLKCIIQPLNVETETGDSFDIF